MSRIRANARSIQHQHALDAAVARQQLTVFCKIQSARSGQLRWREGDQKPPLAIEHSHTMLVRVGHEHAIERVHANAADFLELSIANPFAAPLAQKPPLL